MYTYFLLNCGNGYDGGFVGDMTFDELNWHVGRLNDELKEKHQAQQRHNQKLAASARRR